MWGMMNQHRTFEELEMMVPHRRRSRRRLCGIAILVQHRDSIFVADARERRLHLSSLLVSRLSVSSSRDLFATG